jgi:CHAT domain/SIR2-like domain
MTGYDLEIALHRRDGVHWAVELRFDDPTTETENALVPQSALAVTFDFEKLEQLAHQDMEEYGRILGRSLFTSDVNSALGESRAAAQRAGQPLRIRLFIGPSAPELHALQWETMRDPETDEPLLTDESVHFSRFLTSLDWRPAGARPKSNTRALVVVANPSGLADYENEERRLAPIDVTGEVERARAGLRTVPMTVVARQAEGDDPITLDAMVDRLRHGFDVLYLVCHGYIAQGETQLLFEAATGGVARVAATEFVSAVRHLERTPRLVVLASCQTAGTGDACSTADAGALAPLGPRLAEAGVPAVVAMQGDISMRTVGQFMPIFFSELDSDGRIDRAAAVARWAVRNRPDWWAPALYMRLKTGRLWYSPGFRHDPFDMWPGIVNSIARGQCTPLLGPGLTDSFIGSRQQLAQRWAGTFRFPMEPHFQDDLAHVAQYLAVKYGEEFLPGELGNYLRRELVDRYGDVLTPEAQATVTDGSWDDALSTVAGVRRDAGEFDPFDALAETPFPLYLTIDPSHLLEQALTRAGRTPEVGVCPWNDDLAYKFKVDDAVQQRPTAAAPFVYHLFGQLTDPESLVLTEDNYLDFLMGITANRTLIPDFVIGQLAQSALLFLGFRLDEWEFRVLFRSLMNQEGQERRRRFKHVAVQIDPEEGRTIEPDRARRYLESYFGENRIDIYWGRTSDFVHELHTAWTGRPR